MINACPVVGRAVRPGHCFPKGIEIVIWPSHCLLLLLLLFVVCFVQVGKVYLYLNMCGFVVDDGLCEECRSRSSRS